MKKRVSDTTGKKACALVRECSLGCIKTRAVCSESAKKRMSTSAIGSVIKVSNTYTVSIHTTVCIIVNCSIEYKVFAENVLRLDRYRGEISNKTALKCVIKSVGFN